MPNRFVPSSAAHSPILYRLPSTRFLRSLVELSAEHAKSAVIFGCPPTAAIPAMEQGSQEAPEGFANHMTTTVVVTTAITPKAPCMPPRTGAFAVNIGGHGFKGVRGFGFAQGYV